MTKTGLAQGRDQGADASGRERSDISRDPGGRSSRGEEPPTAVCPACGAAGRRLRNLGKIPPTDVFAGRTLRHVLPSGYLYRCRSCALQFRHPTLPDERLQRLYKEGAESNWENRFADRPDWRVARSWIRDEYETSASVLDVGCNRGVFLDGLGVSYDIYGVEVRGPARREAQQRGVDMIGADWRDLQGGGGTFDVITAFDMIEHTRDPLAFLRGLASRCRPGGAVLISTGNIMHWSARLMGSRYYYCVTAEHLSFVHPRWLRNMAPECGLKLKGVQAYSHYGAGRPGACLTQCAANLVYLVAPALVACARRWGLGGKNAREKPELASFPPVWSALRNHFVAMLMKE